MPLEAFKIKFSVFLVKVNLSQKVVQMSEKSDEKKLATVIVGLFSLEKRRLKIYCYCNSTVILCVCVMLSLTVIVPGNRASITSQQDNYCASLIMSKIFVENLGFKE